MSDSAPVAVDAPTSTAEIASQVIETAENDAAAGGEESYGTSVDASREAVEAGEAKPVAQAAEPLSPEDAAVEALLAEFGFKELRKPDGREHYIPRSKVLKMIGSGLKRGQEKWTTERGVIEGQLTPLREIVSNIQKAAAGDPKAFLEDLAQHDPRYKAFLEPQAAQAQPAAPAAEMPAPDLPLPDGSRTYSLEGLQKLLEWNTQQVEARLLPKVDERLKPWTERERKAKEEEAQTELKTRTRSQVEEAQAWPLFGKLATDGSLTEFQSEVLGELRKEREAAEAAGRRPTMTLRQAYLEAESRYKTTDYNTVRERVIAELKGAPKASALSRHTTDSGRPAGPVNTADIARQVIGKLERGA